MKMPKSKRLRDASKLAWINRLISEEQEAVNSYKDAIANCEDERCLDIYSHILQEEIEHIQELEQLKEEITKPVETKDNKFKDSILQEYASIRRQNEAKYGKDFYSYVNKYLDLNKDLLLSDLYYNEEQWNTFMKWYEQNKIAKNEKFKDSKITYIVVVNCERYASFDNYNDAYQCENSFYNMDEDAEAYYGSYPDVKIIKEDEFGRRIRDSKVKPKNNSLGR